MIPLSNKIKYLMDPTKSKILLEVQKAMESTAESTSEGITAKALLAKLPDISQPTMYRAIKALLAEDILQVAKETPIRGVVEKSYIVSPTFATDVTAIVENNDGAGYLNLFQQYVAGITADFAKYAGRENINILEDMVGFTVAPVYVTPGEFMELNQKIGELIMPLLAQEKTPERQLRNLGLIMGPPQ